MLNRHACVVYDLCNVDSRTEAFRSVRRGHARTVPRSRGEIATFLSLSRLHETHRRHTTRRHDRLLKHLVLDPVDRLVDKNSPAVVIPRVNTT